MKILILTSVMSILIVAFSFGKAAAAIDKDVVLAMPFEEGVGEDTKDLSPPRKSRHIQRGGYMGGWKVWQCASVRAG